MSRPSFSLFPPFSRYHLASSHILSRITSISFYYPALLRAPNSFHHLSLRSFVYFDLAWPLLLGNTLPRGRTCTPHPLTQTFEVSPSLCNQTPHSNSFLQNRIFPSVAPLLSSFLSSVLFCSVPFCSVVVFSLFCFPDLPLCSGLSSFALLPSPSLSYHVSAPLTFHSPSPGSCCAGPILAPCFPSRVRGCGWGSVSYSAL